MSRRRREKLFREEVRELYRLNVPIFYTSQMPPYVGSDSYWRQHGWKVVNKGLPVGFQVIYSLLLITPVHSLISLGALAGKDAAARRAQFWRFHHASALQQQEWLWTEHLEPQFDIGDLDRRLATAAGMLAFSTGETLPTIAERRAELGREIWQSYQRQQRGRLFSMWRIPQWMSAKLDHQFGLEVAQRYDYVPELGQELKDGRE